MLELDFENLKQFKKNLLKRKISFTIEKKRNEVIFVSNGKRIAKAESKNTISHIKNDETRNILSLFAHYFIAFQLPPGQIFISIILFYIVLLFNHFS